MSENYSITKFSNPTFIKQLIRLTIVLPGNLVLIIHNTCKSK